MSHGIAFGDATILAGIALIVMLCVFALEFRRRLRRTRQLQDKLFAAMRKRHPGILWVRVCYARRKHFRRWIKILGAETRGVVGIGRDSVTLRAEFLDGRRLDTVLMKKQIGMEWLGNQRLAPGNLHWLAIWTGIDKIMVAPEAGTSRVPSYAATADLYSLIAPERDIPQESQVRAGWLSLFSPGGPDPR